MTPPKGVALSRGGQLDLPHWRCGVIYRRRRNEGRAAPPLAALAAAWRHGAWPCLLAGCGGATVSLRKA